MTPVNDDIGKVLRAARFAAEKHSGQTRKGCNAEPYINHPLGVAYLISNVGEVSDADIIAAALLHDTVEDTGVTAEEITLAFGEAVCKYVLEVTDDKGLPKARRKELQVEHAPYLSDGAKVIKLADKISNIRDIVDNPPADWNIERRREYIEWGVNVVDGMRGANAQLEAHFDALITRARQSLGSY